MRTYWKAVVIAVAAVALSAGTGGELQAQEIYDGAALAEKPRIASPMAAQRAIQSAYTVSLRDRGIDGRVVLQFVVQPDGAVDPESVLITSSPNPALSDAAKAALVEIQFVPGRMNGTAVPARVSFPISFVAK